MRGRKKKPALTNGEGQPEKRVRKHDLRVPVFPEERDAIEQAAKRAGLSVAAYLREVGQGYRIKGVVDAEQVKELARINGDLGRVGGLLKLWLTNDERTAKFGASHIHTLLELIEDRQAQMADVMMYIVRPRSGNFSG